ncbi:hypothetical protein J2X06_001630 [Lysobacter niastensis]|uniref:DUF3011 domain-containing protein n=1 Tax=Lysobacter niastensis TaxID=380629 RepID=A0ABU1WA45_9GAMM|nr:DUF3011 domain-containing protein [Lysobacter niastensis]MDR7134446.1 hypothetical protein [Lysobacter niastensis]
MTTWVSASAAWTSAALAVVMGLATSSASAAPQYASDRYEGSYGATTVRCDSNDNRYRRCPADTRRGVQLVRQYSDSRCIEGRTWGYDRDAVWVSSGCRAEFAMGRGGWNDGGNHGDGNYDGGNHGNTVRCDSNDNRYRQCPIDARRVVLVRQYSKSQCVEGRTWGYERGYVWVSSGCRAEFASRSGGGWNGGGANNGQGWGQAQTLYCGSDDRRQRRCNVTIRRDARMTRQMSKAACLEGQSWGWDRDGIWVSNGCRAEFAVR